MARVDLPQSRLRARKRRRKIIAGALSVLAVVAVVGLVVGILWLPHWRIAYVEVKGVEGTPAKTIESVARKYIAGTYSFILPKDNILLYPKSGLREYLYAQYPRFAEVEVHMQGLRAIGIKVRERVPESVWCGVSPQSRQACLLMDDSGVAYEPAPEYGTAVYTEYFGAAEGEGMPKHYLTPDTYRSIMALVQAFKDKEGESIARVSVDENDDVRATFVNGFTLMFTRKEDSGDIYERFLLAKTAEPFASRPLGDFEYLDLRFGDRLYYKLKAQ